MGKYSALTAVSTFMLLNPKSAAHFHLVMKSMITGLRSGSIWKD